MKFVFEKETQSKGELLRLWRVCNELSQKQLSEMVGVTQPTINKYEHDYYVGGKHEQAMDQKFEKYIKQYM